MNDTHHLYRIGSDMTWPQVANIQTYNHMVLDNMQIIQAHFSPEQPHPQSALCLC